MPLQSIKSILVCGVLLGALAADAQAVIMNWSAVGNAGNLNDGTGKGAVAYSYNIGTYDVTAGQYVEFLNVKDASGLNGLALYNSQMSSPSSFPEITFHAGNLPGSKYSVISGDQNLPINNVTWYDAIRFANWMNNGQGNGSTETGAYTLGPLSSVAGMTGIPINPPLTHNVGSSVWLPTESEWYKAAYNIPGTNSYFQYPTSSDIIPIISGPTNLPNHANFIQSGSTFGGGPFQPTDVGAYTGTTSPYGAFDMAGNVYQWNEALISGSFRGLRGGSFRSSDHDLLSSSSRTGEAGSLQGAIAFGFRLASVPGVPEPSTGVLAAIAGGMLWWWRKRFK